jgi:hypothetical protein
VKKKIYVRKFESHVQIVNRCAPWKVSSGAENFVLQALKFQQIVVYYKIPDVASMSHATPNECFMEGQFNASA